MKRFYAIVLAIFYFQYASAQANKSLSNLSPTAVNVTILPGSDNSINMGSISKFWRNLYLEGTVYMDGVKFIDHKSGAGAGIATNGYQNTGIDYHALYNNTTGNENTGNDHYAHRSNTLGNSNTTNGSGAFRSNSTGLCSGRFGWKPK